MFRRKLRRPLRTYSDIVWEQFRGNRTAYWSLWLLAPLWLVAVFAPLLASNQPFIFRDGDKWLFPWIRALFTVDEPVNFFFNMSLLAVLPWTVVMPAYRLSEGKHAATGRAWLRRGVNLFVCLSLLLTVLFAIPQLRPSPIYATRSFTQEQAESQGAKWGVYPLIPFGASEQDLDAVFQPPLFRKAAEKSYKSNDGHMHLLGTDDTGRDVLVQLLYGTRISLTVGFLAVGLYLSIGTAIGAVAGYLGGAVDLLISRSIEVVLLFPAFFLILTLVALLGPSIYIIMFVIGITGWPTIARLTRAEILRQRSLDYVAAARASGASHTRILFRHLLPNSLGPALVSAPFGVAGAVMTEAGLSLLGFGVRPPTPSWGTLLRLGSANYHYWWLIVVPSLAIFVLITLFNLIGNGLRDALDPRLRS